MISRVLFFCLLSTSAYSQLNEAFIKHLSVRRLQREHSILLKTSTADSDSTLFFLTKYGFDYGVDSLAILSSDSRLFLSDSNAVNFGSLYFLTRDQPSSIKWINAASKHASFSDRLAYLVNAANAPLLYSEYKPAEDLVRDWNYLLSSYRKKPVVAALLSAAVPGLGKLYAGRKRSFFATLTTHAIFGVQSYELLKRLGPNHLLTIGSLGYFSLFYLTNIYGSYRAVKQRRLEAKRELLINASNYYSRYCDCPLYR